MITDGFYFSIHTNHRFTGKDVYRCRFCAMPFSVPSTLEKHMRKCGAANAGLTNANLNQNSNSSSGMGGGNSLTNLNGSQSNTTPTLTANEQLLVNNNLLGLAGLTSNSLLLNMVNSARNSPSANNNSLLSSLTNTSRFLSSNDQFELMDSS